MHNCHKKRVHYIITSKVGTLIRRFRFFEMIRKPSAPNMPGNLHKFEKLVDLKWKIYLLLRHVFMKFVVK